MSDPLAFLYRGQTEVPDTVKASPLDFLYGENQEEPTKQTGFGEYLKNLAVNGFKMLAVSEGMSVRDPSEDLPVIQQNPEFAQIATELRKSRAEGTGLDIAANDFVHMFSKMFDNLSTQVQQIKASPGEFATAFKEDPIALFGQMGKAMVMPIGDMIEVTSGLQLTEDDVRALTPEEKAQRIKNAAGAAAMIAVGAGVAKGLSNSQRTLRAGLAANEGAALSTEALVKASRLTAKGALARELLKNTAVATASGSTYGAVAFANEDSQLAETIINGVMFAPLGVAFEAVHLGRGTRSRMADAAKAGEIARLRQINDVLGSDMQGVIANAESLTLANSLSEALLQGKLKIADNEVFTLRGAEIDKIAGMVKQIPDNFDFVQHVRNDGTLDMLVFDKSTTKAIDRGMFAQTGLLPNQLVEYKGQKHLVLSSDNQFTTIKSTVDDFTMKVSRSEITTPTFLELDQSTAWKAFNEAETLVGVAVRDRNGKVYSKEGFDGGHAAIKDAPSIGDEDVGFITSKGRFVDRPAAMEIARARDQLRPGRVAEGEWELVAEDIKTPLKGVSYKDAVSRIYDDWKAKMTAPKPSELDVLMEQRTKLAEQVPKASPDELPRLTQEIDQLEARIVKMQRTDLDPIGFDEVPPADEPLVDRVPAADQNYDVEIRSYLEGQGFKPTETVALRDEFHKRLADDVYRNHLEPDDKAFVESAFKSVHSEILKEGQLASQRAHATAENLVTRANRNGMTISDGGAGVFIIRDIESGRMLKRVSSREDAIKFINEAGTTTGINLDSNGSINGKAASRGLLGGPAGELRPEDFPYRGKGRIEAAVNALHIAADFWTPNRNIFTALDTKYGTKLFVEVFDKLQSARRMANAQIRPYYDKLKGIEKIVHKMSSRDRELIGEWMETMTPDEVISKFLPRKLTTFEQQLGQKIAAAGIDLEPVFTFRRLRDSFKKDFLDPRPGEQLTPEQSQQRRNQYQAEVERAKQELGIDLKHEEIADIFDAITGMSKREASLGAIVRLARSIMDGEVSRPEFAARHKMSLEMLRAANDVENLYKELGPIFGIKPEQKLGGYMTHARLYADGNIWRAMGEFSGDAKAREFYAKMARTGEISAYEKDPIRAMQRYIKAGFDAMHFSEALASAKNSLKTETAKLPLAAQEQALRVSERYMSDLQGHPGAGEAATQAAIEALGDRFGLDQSIDVRRSIVNAISATVPAATQGARLMAGIRDLGVGIEISFARFGIKRTRRMIELGAKALTGPMREELERLGDITIASPLTFADATEQATGALRGTTNAAVRGADKLSRGLFRLSGQKDVYALLHAGTYLSTREVAAAELLKLTRGEQKWRAVRKNLKLDTYDQPVAQHFTELVRDGKTDEAARFLAIQTGYENVGVFGLANHPYLWGTNIGRIAGQFGNWPTWFRDVVLRGVSRGTVAQRIGFITRLTAANAAILSVGKEVLGVDLTNWSIFKGLAFMGGPLTDIAQSVNDAIGGYGYIQKTGMSRALRYLPYNPQTGEWQFKQIYLPGSFFADDIVHAIDLAKKGLMPQAAARAAGFRPSLSSGL